MNADDNGGVVVFNVGSSTLKFACFRAGSVLLLGLAENESGTPGPFCSRVRIRDAGGAVVLDSIADFESPRDIIHAVIASIRSLVPHIRIEAYGHRVVHGGDFKEAALITPDVLKELERLAVFAPLHQPSILAAIHELHEREPDVPQVACFDTAFHATMPTVEKMFGIPRKYFDEGVRRYGFHGLAFESVIGQLREKEPDLAGKRVVACHLGSGSSVCGIFEGKSVCTTMGCTPLDGLLMGTRCGRLDPGVVLHLMHGKGMDAVQLSDLLYHRSGLLGVSGISADMRELLASTDPHAVEAVELFSHMAVREIGGVVATLGGIDALVFSGGIGENATPIRNCICDRLAWMGVGGHVPVFVLPADEEAVVARHTLRVAGLEVHSKGNS